MCLAACVKIRFISDEECSVMTFKSLRMTTMKVLFTLQLTIIKWRM
jgi:hypothetical protein